MRRLFEDPRSPTELRDDLLRSKVAGHDYPSADKLAQLKAALDDPDRDPLAEGSHGAGATKQLSWRAVHPGWKLALLLVVGGTATLVLRPGAGEHSPSDVVQPPSAAEPPMREAAVEAAPPMAENAALPTESAAPESAGDQANSSRREIAQLVRIRALL